jgi:hypothetical protein
MQLKFSWLQVIGKQLRAGLERADQNELIPERWVDLILRLDQEERRQSKRDDTRE